MQRPVLMIVDDITKPIRSSLNRLESIRRLGGPDMQSDLVREGLFVLAVASLEVALTEVLRYYLKYFPQKLPLELRANKDDILAPAYVLEPIIDRFLMQLSFKNELEFLSQALQLLSVGKGTVPECHWPR